ncbi:MAG: ATP-dependent acyl-CoA ligase [Gammaproteobacteria bacterium]|nr:ATP-dependent acyl-CoA ligase [Gammaproteobacteria bacterium]
MATYKIPSREACVVHNLINAHALNKPEQVYVYFADHDMRWTYRQLRERILRYATGLQQLGVKQGDFVLSWLPNGPHAVQMFLALNYLGAVYVPINTSYRGGVLQHVIAKSGAKLLIADSRLIDRLTGIDTGILKTLVVVGDNTAGIPALKIFPESVLSEAGGQLSPLQRPIEPWDTHAVIFTSGTTGPSKGVLSSYIHTYEFMQVLQHFGPDDCQFANLPLFHATGIYAVYSMLMHGGRVCVADGFHTNIFWATVNKYGVTTLGLLGVMMQFLLKAPSTPHDRDNTLRTCMLVPLDDDSLRFAERFGVDVYTIYNMTEMSGPLYAGPNPTVSGTCGKARPGVDLRLVDENDIEVGEGHVGELIVRTDMPWAMNHGYHNDPEATARAWRNGWFHTGDALRRDADGNYFFVDRMKDTIRRRGENISSFEVENEITVHPDVREVAVIGVASSVGEDDVLAVIAPVAGRRIDPAAIIEFIRPRLAYYMVPRYIRFINELPKTPTQKVTKQQLRDEGVTVDTWDREAAGIIIKRDSLK